MQDFLKEMANILDEESVEAGDVLNDFDSWDSLAILSVISMADEKFGTTFTAQQIRSATTVGELFALISTNGGTGSP